MKKKYGFTAKAGTKKAFTLAEVLITLVVLGVAIALTVPSIIQKKPNENMAKFKKAYATAERTILSLDDETFYPEDGNDPFLANGNTNICLNSNSAGNCNKPALMNTIDRVVGGITYGATLANSNSNAAREKFCNIFASQVNTTGPINCANPTVFVNGNANNNPSFVTTDGIQWVISPAAFGRNKANGMWRNALGSDHNNGAIEIWVDVNSGTRSPNTAGGVNPDRFRIWIDFDGKMTIPNADTVAIQYLRQTSPSFKCRNAACN